MSAHTLDLSCACGAALHLDTQWGDTLRAERAAFNMAHKSCVPAPGPCGAGSFGFTGRDYFCSLRAGHAGFHEAGDGSSWGRRTVTYPVSG